MSNVFYFTDVHGQWDLYAAMKAYAFQDKKSKIIYGGDACDRGLYGYKIMKDMLSCPRIIYLKGNHEDIFVKSARAILNKPSLFKKNKTSKEVKHKVEEFAFENKYVYMSYRNQGIMTLVDWIMDGASVNFINKIEALPVVYSYNNLDFTHACPMPKSFELVKIGGSGLEIAAAIDKCLWDRDHQSWGWTENRINVCGHTPVSFLHSKVYIEDTDPTTLRPFMWQGIVAKDKFPGYRLDMDTGMFFSGRGFILNCDTFEVIGFRDPKIGNMNSQDPVIEIEKYKIFN